MQPEIRNLNTAYQKKLYESPFRPYLEEKIGKVAFKNMELAMRSVDEKILPLMQEENKLQTQYNLLLATAKIDWKGETLNLSLMNPYLHHPDRSVRLEAWKKYSEFFSANREQLDDIYDRLVKNRTQQAVMMGGKNYLDLGIDMIWLDNAEPDYVKYDFDQYRYYLGTALSCSNIWPQYYSRAIYDNMIKDGRKNPVNLIRSAWAGSQKYGNVIWSGDVPSTFESLRDQLQCGINMGLAGIPWWTTDIGGFMTDDVNDPKFRQLLIRWFEFAVFTAVLRMHGDRGPYDIPPLDNRDWGGGYLKTGHANELWSYGEENFRIMKKFLDLRLSMHDYIASLYKEAEENGSPLLRAMFYEFPDDEKCWNLYDQYMFGSQYLVAPILFEDTYERDVYLPEGTWLDTRANEQIEGGRVIHTHVPLDEIAVYQKI